MNVLDLFSGIGGFSLGLERAGMRTVAFCEIDPYCREVLRKHWPDVPIHGDICTLKVKTLADTEYDGPPAFTELAGAANQGRLFQSQRYRIDIICGGFPCQDISVAGKGAGIEGARSGLWNEFARIIGEVRPRYVIVENVAALLGRGIERVLGNLAALGFDAEWHCIPASAVGAPHRRDRVWIVAYARSSRGRPPAARYGGLSPEPTELQSANGQACPDYDAPLCGDVAYAEQSGLEGCTRRGLSGSWGASIKLACGDWWQSEPDLGRVAHGVPFRVDRLRSLGNAIVPQIAEIIGKTIMAHGT